MTGRRFVILVVRAAIFGLVLAVPLSGWELVSVEIWMVVTGVLVAAALLRRLLRVANLEGASMAVAWTWRRRRQPHRPDRRPMELRAIEGILASALHNPRAHVSQLRPRLTPLAEHFGPIRLTAGQGAGSVGDQLGDVAWLIDDGEADRTPTVDEIDRFLDIILAERDIRPHPHRPEGD